MKHALNYKDICLVPEYSDYVTRSNADTSIEFLGNHFNLPVIPSNMKCVINEKIAHKLSSNNYFYVLHRFGIDNYEFVKKAQLWDTVSISIGVGLADKEFLMKVAEENLLIDYITIDIAHGHSSLMRDMLSFIQKLGIQSKIIAGNVCTPDGYKFLVDHGADAVKAGIGTGTVCSTFNKTGFTYPMYSCISEINKHKTKVPIIADGGIREHGDIIKAIHAGADMVMAGNIFSKLIDSPADMIDGHKIYFGSASQFNKGEYKHVEGVKKILELDPMTYLEKLAEIEQDIQSAMSYAGARQSVYQIRKVKHKVIK